MSGACQRHAFKFGPQVLVSKPASARAVASCGSRQKSAGGAAVAPGARRGVPAARRRRCPGRAGWHGPLDVGCWRWGAAGSVSRQGSPRSACHFQSSPRRSALSPLLSRTIALRCPSCRASASIMDVQHPAARGVREGCSNERRRRARVGKTSCPCPIRLSPSPLGHCMPAVDARRLVI